MVIFAFLGGADLGKDGARKKLLSVEEAKVQAYGFYGKEGAGLVFPVFSRFFSILVVFEQVSL